MRVVAIVQARMGSTRLPKKVLRPIAGVPLIDWLLSRLSKAKRIDEIVVATSDRPVDDPLVDHVKKLGFACERGSETDVLDRFVQTARIHRAEAIVRITGDCPMVDPRLVDAVVDGFLQAKTEYFSNVDPPTYPDGLDIEVFTLKALERAHRETQVASDREHVTPYLRESGRFSKSGIVHDVDESARRWTVDEAIDLEVMEGVFQALSSKTLFGWKEVLALAESRPELFEKNRGLNRNEGGAMGTGQKLWKRAKAVIPGGSMLLSKRAEMFAPEQWPAYFSRTQGCRVWDLDDRPYDDVSMMGIGTNTLGYSHPEVDAAVTAVVQRGNLSTLNCPEEVYLAERLVALHPWSEMVRFARSGGEANAIAIRLGRAASGRDGVAISGYHGWHDWYLSANLGDDANLDGHLLPGLNPKGVPQGLRGTVIPFAFNDYEALENIVSTGKIGVIKMEVMRNVPPAEGFLQKVRALADRQGIVLIFDECTSGFRETFGGLHLKYGVSPDLAVFGKTLGNGYAITAVLGRRAVMQEAQATFISSTFWTERIGPAAALKTLDVMERERSWETITAIGSDLIQRWKALGQKHGLPLQAGGLPALAGFSFSGPSALAYKTFITQEMLSAGFLATTSVYACTAHTPEVIEKYAAALDPIFATLRECEDGRDITALLRGPVCHGGFKRLN